MSSERQTLAASIEAIDLLKERLVQKTGDSHADLLIISMTVHHAQHATELLAAIRQRLHVSELVGISSEAVLSGATEVEASPALAMLAIVAPDASIRSFSSDDIVPMLPSLGDEPTSPEDIFLQRTRVAAATGISPSLRGMLILADPFTTPVAPLLYAIGDCIGQICDTDNPPPIVGGLASGARRPGAVTILHNNTIRTSGAAVVTFSGNINLSAVVSQGTRPFGPTFVVTKSQGQFLYELGGKPAFAVLREMIEDIAEDQRKLVASSLMLGVAADENKSHLGRGDFLMRPVVGVMPEQDAIAIAEPVRVGKTVRFHTRDSRTASEDLQMLMDVQALKGPPKGIIVCTCNGRGTRLFSTPAHDATVIQSAFLDAEPAESRAKGGTKLSPGSGSTAQSPEQSGLLIAKFLPLVGFFAAGEIGPVANTPQLHGLTCCAIFLRDQDPADEVKPL